MKGLLTSILTVLTFTGLQAQPLPSTPKLVVGLTIDQLRTDYLEAFSTLYGDRGFRRLWKEGRVFRECRIYFQRHGPRISHSRYLYRHHSFGQRHYRQTMDGCIDTAYCELCRRPRFHGQLYKRKLFAFPSPDLYDSR